MTEYELIRTKMGDDGTFGELNAEGAVFYTAELPWRDNKRDVSCIPAGIYAVLPHKSPTFGGCFRLQNVPQREDILIHAGNYAGDISKGYRSDVRGCILLGEGVHVLNGQPALKNSRKAVEKFNALIGKKAFTLVIKNQYHDYEESAPSGKKT